MCRSKRLLAALMCAVCLSACAAAEGSPNILYLEQAEEPSPETVQVTRGEFSQTYSADAAPYYPHVCNVRMEVGNARFVEYHFRTGDAVKAGDLLVTFTRDVDEVSLERKRLALRRGEEDYARTVQEWDEKLADMYDELSLTTAPAKRKRLKLEIQRAELQRDKYVHETEYDLAIMREDIAEMEADWGMTGIVAPMDGVVRIVAYKQAGEKLASGELLMTITSHEGMLIGVENKNGFFRYGMDVTVEIGTAKNRITATGTVVATDMLIPEAMRKNHAVIRVDADIPVSVNVNRAKAYAQAYYLDNVLVLPKQAVTLSEGKYSVELWLNGKSSKRYVNFAMNAQSLSLILDGVDEGDMVIID